MIPSEDSRPLVVVSAINVTMAGPMSIMQDFLAALIAWNREGGRRCRIVLFAHSADLYPAFGPEELEIISIPRSRRSWLNRIFFEYVYFYFWSRRRDVHTWIAMHDVTPNVVAAHRVVYCHHASPFYSGPRSRLSREWSFALQRRVYSTFYRFNLFRNDFVIVQQQWLREAFAKRFALPRERIIVAKPSVQPPPVTEPRPSGPDTILFYPSFPRFFKNFETVLAAMSELKDLPVRLILTFKGDETEYAAAIRERARGMSNVEWHGFVSRDETFRLYAHCDAVVFASRLESFGLPLVELQSFRKPVFASALPYAEEALSGYDQCVFFDPDDPAQLAALLRGFVETRSFPAKRVEVACHEPFASDWPGLIRLLERSSVLPSGDPARGAAHE